MGKKEEIIEKSRVMFMKYGLRSVSMDDISKELNISKKTIYELFEDKATLIKSIIEIEIKRKMPDMENLFRNDINAIERMFEINKFIIKVRKGTPQNIVFELQKYYPEILKDLKCQTESNMLKTVKENLQKGQKEGLIRKNINLDIISALQVKRSGMIDEITEMLKIDYEDILTEILDYHIRAIATEKGIKIYETLKNQK